MPISNEFDDLLNYFDALDTAPHLPRRMPPNEWIRATEFASDNSSKQGRSNVDRRLTAKIIHRGSLKCNPLINRVIKKRKESQCLIQKIQKRS